MQTPSGQALLARLYIQHSPQKQYRVSVPELRRYHALVHPIPSKMGTHTHDGRRTARAQALAHKYGPKHGVFYVDIAGPDNRGLVHSRNYTPRQAGGRFEL